MQLGPRLYVKFHEFDHFGGSVLDIWHFGSPLTDVQCQQIVKLKTEDWQLGK